LALEEDSGAGAQNEKKTLQATVDDIGKTYAEDTDRYKRDISLDKMLGV
jgi:hypothetical protein